MLINSKNPCRKVIVSQKKPERVSQFQNNYIGIKLRQLQICMFYLLFLSLFRSASLSLFSSLSRLPSVSLPPHLYISDLYLSSHLYLSSPLSLSLSLSLSLHGSLFDVHSFGGLSLYAKPRLSLGLGTVVVKRITRITQNEFV